ncbi:MAG TPA: ATP-dependent DNA helicase RecG [Verrucomicrobiae bacterium]|nr:ATP-dependent DNA helicase RecG [Verrucomicrobiae bacterium]
MLRWDEPVSFIKGATPSVRNAWQSLGIRTIGDLLTTIPRRYDDYSKVTEIRNAMNGDTVTIKGKVVKSAMLPSFRKKIKIFKVTVEDPTGKITANFFNQPWVLDELTEGRDVFLSGKIKFDVRFGKSITSPIWEPAERETIAAGKLAPVYGLAGTLVQKTYRRLVQYAIENLATASLGFENEELTLAYVKAIRSVHEPENAEQAEEGRKALAYHEMLAYQVALRGARREADIHGAPAVTFNERFAKSFVADLPFPLTGDQKRAAWACFKDMEATRPMRRLLQGDVGSGKTAVAGFLMAHVQQAGASAAFLAPTDILAKQHAESLKRLYGRKPIPTFVITRTTKTEGWEDAVRQGNAIFIGTHALLEAGRLPSDLALAVVDEQHRFGVDQREAMVNDVRQDGKVPHLLSMTATPIPRSLALVLYGDLDVSLIREKPAGRQPIKTKVCHGRNREDAYEAIRAAVKRGERAFIVCPLIDPSDALGVSSATEESKRLGKEALSGIKIGLLHGRMKAKEKDEAMQAFIDGETPVLVSTTVIEVGVDVPMATVIAIEGAERFGLAQLHQLRGRVGRSHLPSHCFLMTDAEGEPYQRLKLLETVDDGFRLAEEDLKRRGSGNLFGTQQSGELGLRITRLTDTDIFAKAQRDAAEITANDPELTNHPHLKMAVEELRVTSHLE